MRLSVVELPMSLQLGIRLNYISSVIQFGSSIYIEDPNDCDLAVIVKDEFHLSFLDLVKPEEYLDFDISLITVSEASVPSSKFRYGSHGPHLVISFASGHSIYGTNPFKNNLAIEELKRSLFERLTDYMYDVRKLPFDSSINLQKVTSRWKKFARISIFLVNEDSIYTFPDVLYISDKSTESVLSNKFDCDSDDVIVAKYEKVWKCISKYNF